MPNQARFFRRIASVPIVANGFATVDLPRDHDYEALGFRINASLQVTVLATSVRAEAPCQLVPRVEIIADGKNNLASAPLWYFALGNVRGAVGQSGARATVPPTGVAVATYAVQANAVIPFASLDCIRPKDTNFRSRGLSLLQARLTFGAAGDCFVGGTVAFSGSPTVEVWSVQMEESIDAQGNFATSPEMVRKVSFQEIALGVSNANQEIRLPAGNLIRSVFFRTDGSVTAGEPSATVLNNAQLVNGTDVRFNLSGENIRAFNNQTYGQVNTGYYLADMLGMLSSGARKLSELWDVTQAAEPKAIMDVTGGANVKAQIVTEEYILARAA